ncbi:CLH1 [Linum grandiflorum]
MVTKSKETAAIRLDLRGRCTWLLQPDPENTRYSYSHTAPSLTATSIRLSSPTFLPMATLSSPHCCLCCIACMATQLFDAMFFMPCELEEIDYLAQVIRWLPTGLSSILLDDVVPDFDHLAIGGHSRGGKSAFALALGYARRPDDDFTISALVGIDPVAGGSKDSRTNPKILTYQPESFNLTMPVAVIGSGLGNQSAFFGFPACAPNEVSHVEFYNECRAPKSHVVPAEFGHMDIVDDVNPVDLVNYLMTNNMCKSGVSWFNSRDKMRSTVGGIVVAFLNSCFGGKGDDDYLTILRKPEVSPAKLQPPQYEFSSLAQE